MAGSSGPSNNDFDRRIKAYNRHRHSDVDIGIERYLHLDFSKGNSQSKLFLQGLKVIGLALTFFITVPLLIARTVNRGLLAQEVQVQKEKTQAKEAQDERLKESVREDIDVNKLEKAESVVNGQRYIVDIRQDEDTTPRLHYAFKYALDQDNEESDQGDGTVLMEWWGVTTDATTGKTSEEVYSVLVAKTEVVIEHGDQYKNGICGPIRPWEDRELLISEIKVRNESTGEIEEVSKSMASVYLPEVEVDINDL